MRYAYGVTSALLLGGATISLITGQPAGAQVAQNDDARITAVTPRAGAPASFADLTEQLAPAVVNISTRQRVEVQSSNPFAGTPFEGMFGDRGGDQPTTREGQSLGSGFLISADGYVVTNNHVVTPQGNGTVEEITVTMPDGSEYEAKMVGKDAESDLAVLKIDRAEPFPFVKFGDSAQARAGDWVVAIGNPFGLGGTVTSGIISSVLRTAGAGAYDRFIQTDAAINRGNSGGPLFNMDGQVIGVNTAILSPNGGSIGIGFAMASNVVTKVVDQLKEFGETRRGWLGVRIQDVSDDVAEAMGLSSTNGALVTDVPDGPAKDAGMEAGDLILSFAGEEVANTRELVRIVGNSGVGETVRVVVLRDGQTQTLKVVLGRREEALANDEGGSSNDSTPTPEVQQQTILGMTLSEMTDELREELGLDAGAQGLVVTAVQADSEAAAKGLIEGDVITEAGQQQLTSIAQLEERIASARDGGRQSLLLLVRRGGDPRFVALPVTE